MPVINITKAIAEQVGNSVKRHHACCWLVADDLECRALVIELVKLNGQFMQTRLSDACGVALIETARTAS